MELEIGSRIVHAWNAFKNNRDPTRRFRPFGVSHSYNPVIPRLSYRNEKTIVNAIYNRIAIDVADVNIRHCRLDDNGRFLEEINSGLNRCLRLEPNIDQTARAFIHDITLSCLDEGCVAVVPTEADDDPIENDCFGISQLRVGKILEWYPDAVRVQLYNDFTGEKSELVYPKKSVAIIENPFYAVINEPNSTIQRLIRKLALLDYSDENAASGKLDLIIQLPYTVKSEARRNEAEIRRERLEKQLTDSSKYGVAYVDSTEKIIQLNRSLENNLLTQIEYFTNQAYSQLGITEAILNNTANEQEMLNYKNRIVLPFVQAIVDEFNRKFLTNTARTQKQSIEYFSDPFKLVPVNNIAEIADKFTRNEIMTSNEIRQIIGMKPSDDPKADELRNSNISESKAEIANDQAIINEERSNSQNGN